MGRGRGLPWPKSLWPIPRFVLRANLQPFHGTTLCRLQIHGCVKFTSRLMSWESGGSNHFLPQRHLCPDPVLYRVLSVLSERRSHPTTRAERTKLGGQGVTYIAQ